MEKKIFKCIGAVSAGFILTLTLTGCLDIFWWEIATKDIMTTNSSR